MSIYDLLQTSKVQRYALIKVLKSIEVQSQDGEAFTNFVGHVQSCNSRAITFYEHEIIESRHLGQHPPLFIIYYIKGQNFKRFLIDNGSILNVISSSTLYHLKIPQSSLLSSIL